MSLLLLAALALPVDDSDAPGAIVAQPTAIESFCAELRGLDINHRDIPEQQLCRLAALIRSNDPRVVQVGAYLAGKYNRVEYTSDLLRALHDRLTQVERLPYAAEERSADFLADALILLDASVPETDLERLSDLGLKHDALILYARDSEAEVANTEVQVSDPLWALEPMAQEAPCEVAFGVLADREVPGLAYKLASEMTVEVVFEVQLVDDDWTTTFAPRPFHCGGPPCHCAHMEVFPIWPPIPEYSLSKSDRGVVFFERNAASYSWTRMERSRCRMHGFRTYYERPAEARNRRLSLLAELLGDTAPPLSAEVKHKLFWRGHKNLLNAQEKELERLFKEFGDLAGALLDAKLVSVQEHNEIRESFSISETTYGFEAIGDDMLLKYDGAEWPLFEPRVVRDSRAL